MLGWIRMLRWMAVLPLLPLLSKDAPWPPGFSVETNLWQGRNRIPAPRSVSIIAEKYHGAFGEEMEVLGDLDGDGRPEWIAAGGRAGTESSAGRAVIAGLDAQGTPVVHRVFEGPAQRPGYGRIMTAHRRTDGRTLLGIGRAERGVPPLLELWWLVPGQEWEPVPGPDSRALSGLNDLLIPGDLTGDGREDLVLAVDTGGQVGLRVFAGTGNGFSSQPVHRIDWPGPDFGPRPAVHPAGDVDGDGRQDLLVAFTGEKTTSPGAVVLLPGRSLDDPAGPASTWRGVPQDLFGQAILRIDLDDDGRLDLLVGAPGSNDGRGKLYGYRGRPGGWESRPCLEVDGAHPGENLGHALAAGRLAGRGRDLFLVLGAPGSPWEYLRSGLAYVLPVPALRSGGIDELPALWIWGGRPAAEVGRDLQVPGDLDGDGCDDLLLGIPFVGHFGNKSGRVDVLFGSSDWPTRGAWRLTYPRDTVLHISYPGTTVNPPPPDALPEAAVRPAGATGSLRNPMLVASGLLMVVGGLWWWQQRIENTAREKERRRIAQNLHDDLGGHLVRLSGPTQAASPDMAREITTRIEQAIWSIHPDRQSLLDLATGLTDMAGTLFGDLPMRRRFEFPDPMPDLQMKPGILEAVARASQEALNNVLKHSQATEVTLSLSPNGSGWEVRIRDNGVGIPAGGPPRSGMGLGNMAGRLREVGGRCHVGPHPEGGTLVRLQWPAG